MSFLHAASLQEFWNTSVVLRSREEKFPRCNTKVHVFCSLHGILHRGSPVHCYEVALGTCNDVISAHPLYLDAIVLVSLVTCSALFHTCLLSVPYCGSQHAVMVADNQLSHGMWVPMTGQRCCAWPFLQPHYMDRFQKPVLSHWLLAGDRRQESAHWLLACTKSVLAGPCCFRDQILCHHCFWSPTNSPSLQELSTL